MNALRRLSLTALAVAAASLATAEAASALTIGDHPRPRAGRVTARHVPGRRDPPRSGRRCAVGARLLARHDVDAVRRPGRRLPDAGPLYAGKVGEVHEGGVFRPYELGAGSVSCGGAEPGQERGLNAGIDTLFAVHPSAPCFRGEAPRIPGCGPANVRKVSSGLAGKGVFAAWVEKDGRWVRTRLSAPDNAYLAVLDGEQTGRVKFRALLCGPNARPLLKTIPGAVVDRCTVTVVIPPPLPPFPPGGTGTPPGPGTPAPSITTESLTG